MSPALTCAHVLVTGRRCPGAPLPGQTFCHFHYQLHQSELLPGMPEYQLPICEDSRSIMIAGQQIMQAQLLGLIDLKTAGKLFYCLRLMSSLTRQPDFAQTAPEPAEPYKGGPRNMTEFVLQYLNDLPHHQHEIQPRPFSDEETPIYPASTPGHAEPASAGEASMLSHTAQHASALTHHLCCHPERGPDEPIPARVEGPAASKPAMTTDSVPQVRAPFGAARGFSAGELPMSEPPSEPATGTAVPHRQATS
ncbi:MAG TPA: hypothetical protein VEG30_08720 [Terriglobales bacterium]|nr:hypothetical protein [Terriglobales bacterium]